MSVINPAAVNQAYKGMFIGDAVAMPVHWYYEAAKIKEHYNGWIKQYESPKEKHAASYMSLPPEGEGLPPQVIGTVIMHGKAEAWKNETKDVHYHKGMEAGENTLNCALALRAMKILAECDSSVSDKDVMKRIFSGFVEFMTNPGKHNDTYCESWIKTFFIDWVVAGKPKGEDAVFKFATARSERILATNDASFAMIGGAVVTTAIILHNIHRPLEEVMEVAKEYYGRTHPVEDMVKPLNLYIKILHKLVRGGSLKEEAEKGLLEHFGENGQETLKRFDDIVSSSADELSAFQKIAQELGLQCSIKSALPIVLYIGRYFHSNFEGGILMNVNIGGENVHRGAALGALLGATCGGHGGQIPTKWTDGLKWNSTIDNVLSK